MDNARHGRKVALWAAGAVVATGALIAVLVTLGGSSETVEPTTGPTEASDGCAGVEGQSIDLDTQVVQPEPRTCFELDAAASVTIGAAALEPTDTIELAVYDATGTQLGSAASAPEWDPEVSVELEPGSYVIEVTGLVMGEDPPFLLYTATFAPQPGASPAPGEGVDTASVPPAEACGAEVPQLADDAPVSVVDDSSAADATLDPSAAGDVHYACVVVDEPVFAKVGVASEDPDDIDSPDLTMAVYLASDDGDATLVRTADDAIGFDPETSLALEPGTYMVAASAWLGGATGAVEIYYDDDADLFRRSEATSMHAGVTPDVCDDGASVAPGDTLTVEGERTYVCLDNDQAQRLTIQAATLTDQDLVLEVLGFDEAPYRLAWADGNPYSDVLADFDPLLDQTVPEGQWIIAVTTYFTGTAADYDLRIVPGGGE
ncbi:hypothetical protein [Demequina muriae]|uniref:Pre-peptidase C-terminal domain-containing protein n=1 Tax=Demequina muriae TaxID=3051664 RepID=A0ABT8GDY3_9MICO|nr:hypothetical protein [Demequina sp. EGI L300058]MDN4479638.1 hypothetical protein [Demequina sp. EGI L300058]